MPHTNQIALHLQNASNSQQIPRLALIRQWVELALNRHHKKAELTIRIVDEKEMMKLNETYRHKQGPTNVLSFPAELPKEVETSLLGDIVICAPIIEKEAKEQHKTLNAHWAHITIHGCLHLLGFDHTQEQDAEEMEQLEITLLKKLGIENPYTSPGTK